MELDYAVYRIHLNHTFGISRSKNDWYDIIIIFLIDGEFIGRGEAAPSIRYNESSDRILSVLRNKVTLPDNCLDREMIWNHILPKCEGIKALEAAFSMALWDWWGQKKQKPISELLSIDNSNLPLTSYTIAIGDLDEIGQKIEEAEPYSILKVKLGTPNNDKEIIKEIRKLTDKLIRVDANEGWDYDNALKMCNWLAEQNIEFVEQPFPASKLEQTKILKDNSPLDIYADENSVSSNDIYDIKEAFDGINIKLMKCGSLEEGKKMIILARQFDLKIMLGCMVETSIGITAASHLAGEVDVADLDGNLLINNDPYIGVKVIDGKLTLPRSNGAGIQLNSKIAGLI